MLSVDENPPDRRAKSRQLIGSLVASRVDALGLYSQLVTRLAESRDQSAHELLQRFCQALIDYTASAHFQLYKYIDEQTERRRPVMLVASEVYPRIVDITQLIVDFNDKYDCDFDEENFTQLPNDLARLGEALISRVELEDRLIRALRG